MNNMAPSPNRRMCASSSATPKFAFSKLHIPQNVIGNCTIKR